MLPLRGKHCSPAHTAGPACRHRKLCLPQPPPRLLRTSDHVPQHPRFEPSSPCNLPARGAETTCHAPLIVPRKGSANLETGRAHARAHQVRCPTPHHYHPWRAPAYASRPPHRQWPTRIPRPPVSLRSSHPHSLGIAIEQRRDNDKRRETVGNDMPWCVGPAALLICREIKTTLNKVAASGCQEWSATHKLRTERVAKRLAQGGSTFGTGVPPHG
jgi:hypothetical protein